MELSNRDEQAQTPLRSSKPRPQTAIVAMALILPSLVGVFWLSFQIPRQFANRKSLRTAGVSATAKIDKVVSARGSQLWVKYTFEAEGRTITNETEAPKSLEGVLYQAETINIRYLPSDPEINHPSEWEWSLWSESIWIAVFVWAIPGFILLLRIGKRPMAAVSVTEDRSHSKGGLDPSHPETGKDKDDV